MAVTAARNHAKTGDTHQPVGATIGRPPCTAAKAGDQWSPLRYRRKPCTHRRAGGLLPPPKPSPLGKGDRAPRWMRACRQSAQHGGMLCFLQSLISRFQDVFRFRIAKSSVFSRRRKTPRDALRLVQLFPTGEAGDVRRPAIQRKRTSCLPRGGSLNYHIPNGDLYIWKKTRN